MQNRIFSIIQQKQMTLTQVKLTLSDQPGLNYIAEFLRGQGALTLSYYNTGDIPLESHSNQMISAIQNNPQAKLIENHQFEISGRPAGLMAYQISDGTGTPVFALNSWIKQGNQGYLHFVFVTTDLQTYNNLAPSALNIIRSVEVQGNGNTSSNEQPIIGSEPPQCGSDPYIKTQRPPITPPKAPGGEPGEKGDLIDICMKTTGHSEDYCRYAIYGPLPKS
jgi:hypothetical protein